MWKQVWPNVKKALIYMYFGPAVLFLEMDPEEIAMYMKRYNNMHWSIIRNNEVQNQEIA